MTAKKESEDTDATEASDVSDDVLVRHWRDRTKYVCGLCEHQCFHALGNREAVEEHIRRHH